MPETLAEALHDMLRQRGVGASDRQRADYLGVDPTTFSKVVRGNMPLTQDRAEKWSAKICAADPSAAPAFAERLMSAARQLDEPLTIAQFSERVRAEGGAVPGERIADLFSALLLDNVQSPLICVEYRDIPRAGRAGKYENLAGILTDAIQEKLAFAMFQPFGLEIPIKTNDIKVADDRVFPSITAATYMLQVREKCRAAYVSYCRAVEGGGQEDCAGATSRSEAYSAAKTRIALYERQGGSAYLGSGLQAKALYLQYAIRQADGKSFREERVFEWVSTPGGDLLIYLGDDASLAEAIRDTLYPIPQYYSLSSELPTDYSAAHTAITDANGGDVGLPVNYNVWKRYDRSGSGN